MIRDLWQELANTCTHEEFRELFEYCMQGVTYPYLVVDTTRGRPALSFAGRLKALLSVLIVVTIKRLDEFALILNGKLIEAKGLERLDLLARSALQRESGWLHVLVWVKHKKKLTGTSD